MKPRIISHYYPRRKARYELLIRLIRNKGLNLEKMIVLGIESSCDETGIALFDSEKGLLSHTLHSQIEIHAEYGGVVPELASRDHIRHIIPLMEQALEQANLEKQQ